MPEFILIAFAVNLKLPKNYIVKKKWVLTNADINAGNTADNRDEIIPSVFDLEGKNNKVSLIIEPCGLYLIQCVAQQLVK